MAPPQNVALITGAASGLGRQLTIDLAQRGWNIGGLDQNEVALQALERQLGKQSSQFAGGIADITDAALLQKERTKLESRLGSISLLIACAGIAELTPAANMDAAAIARIINVNLIGASNTIAAVLPQMLARRRGHVVAISSLASFRGLPGQMGYCASKAGLNALLESLWLDVKDKGIVVTTICPGHIRTPQSTGMFKDEYLMP